MITQFQKQHWIPSPKDNYLYIQPELWLLGQRELSFFTMIFFHFIYFHAQFQAPLFPNTFATYGVKIPWSWPLLANAGDQMRHPWGVFVFTATFQPSVVSCVDYWAWGVRTILKASLTSGGFLKKNTRGEKCFNIAVSLTIAEWSVSALHPISRIVDTNWSS